MMREEKREDGRGVEGGWEKRRGRMGEEEKEEDGRKVVKYGKRLLFGGRGSLSCVCVCLYVRVLWRVFGRGTNGLQQLLSKSVHFFFDQLHLSFRFCTYHQLHPISIFTTS